MHRRARHVGSQWCLDATQVGRAADGGPIQAEVLLDAASRELLSVTVGGPSHAGDVVALLEGAAVAQGAPPLVLQTENGSAYASEAVGAWLARRRVLHLKSLPPTPQHNPQAERAIGLLKQAAEIGPGKALFRSCSTAREALLGGKAPCWAAQAHSSGSRWYTNVARREVYQDALQRREAALASDRNGRDRRRAERQAILDTLLHHQLIDQSRGSAKGQAVKRERES